MLTKNVVPFLEKKFPFKLKDIGSLTIPYTIRSSYYAKTLCDLEISVNFIPLSIFKKFGLREPKPTMVSL